MEVRLMLMCSGILLSFSPVICADSDIHSEFDDKTIDDSSHSGSTVVKLQNTFHFSQQQIPTTEGDITETDQKKLTETKIDSLMQSITRLENMLISLDIKLSRILEKDDVRNERPSEKVNFDWVKELEKSWRTAEGLETVAGIDDNPIQIDNESLYRRLEDNVPNYESNGNEITRLGRNNFNYPNPVEAKTTHRYENNFTIPTTNTATTNSVASKRTYQAMKKDTLRVILDPYKFNCDELQKQLNGIYKFGSLEEKANEGGRFYYERYCDFATADKVGWTVIQRRFANNHRLSFNRTWSEYKYGFGDLDSEFWFGNDFIHKLTSERDFELRIIFEDENGRTDLAEYSLFKMESEDDQYKLVIEGYRGTITDSFQYLNGQAFSTFDRRHGKHDDGSCAAQIGNGWWFKNCTAKNLGNWFGSTSTKMMVRPTNSKSSSYEPLRSYEHAKQKITSLLP